MWMNQAADPPGLPGFDFEKVKLGIFACFRLLSKQNRLTMTRNAVWALSNLCRGKNPPPDFAKVRIIWKEIYCEVVVVYK